MTKYLGTKFIAGVFLFVFFSKMIISVVPLIVEYSNSEQVIAVIMQLEIENNTKETDQTKDKTGKDFCYNTHFAPSFSAPLHHFVLKASPVQKHGHIQSFYPAVPTPPPNAC